MRHHLLPALLALTACGSDVLVGKTGGGGTDADSDGYDDTVDCDDAHATVNPDAPETCNGVDDDCDGEIDEDAVDAPTWYADGDADGFGDPATPLVACEAPEGAVADATDCDDATGEVHPDSDEVCNDIDDDCDGLVDDADDSLSGPAGWYVDEDGDGHGDANQPLGGCAQPEGAVADADDCDDTDPDVSPSAVEDCGTPHDDDCDGALDARDAAGCTDWFADGDGDGHGGGSAECWCEATSGSVETDGDCDDTDDTVHPGASEVCGDGVDSDCDGADRACYSGMYDENTADGYWAAEDTTGRLGVGLAPAGDLDGDGTEDLVAGDPSFRGAGSTSGGVWIIYGSTSVDNGGAGLLETVASIEGDATAGAIGTGLAPAGDHDEDGYDDLLIGSGDGAVLIYGGAPLSHGESITAVMGAVFSDAATAHEGVYLGGHAADLDGDGHQDIVMSDWLGTSGTGRIILHYGDGTAASGTVDISGDAELYEPSSPLGYRNALDMGDLDGDGLSEIIVGYFWRVSASNYDGRAWLVPGDATQRTGRADIASVADAWWTGASGDRLAAGLAIAPDMDGDGLDELVIGANYADERATNGGAAYVYAGGTAFTGATSTSSADLIIEGETADEHFGYRVAGAPDMDGDGFGDLVVTATDHPVAGGRGAVLVYPGGSGALTGTLGSSDAAWGWQGDADGAVYNRVVAGDFDGDGLTDLATPRLSTGGYGQGLDLFLGGGER